MIREWRRAHGASRQRDGRDWRDGEERAGSRQPAASISNAECGTGNAERNAQSVFCRSKLRLRSESQVEPAPTNAERGTWEAERQESAAFAEASAPREPRSSGQQTGVRTDDR
jgi:hypothetical protein